MKVTWQEYLRRKYSMGISIDNNMNAQVCVFPLHEFSYKDPEFKYRTYV
jgi:hypothetical protein